MIKDPLKSSHALYESADSFEGMHAHWALLLDEEPLVDAVNVKVVLAGRQDFHRIVCEEDLLAHDADLLPESSAYPATGLLGAA